MGKVELGILKYSITIFLNLKSYSRILVNPNLPFVNYYSFTFMVLLKNEIAQSQKIKDVLDGLITYYNDYSYSYSKINHSKQTFFTGCTLYNMHLVAFQ